MPHPQFVEDVLNIVARIPAGRVMTYGDVAHALGSRAARQVGQILAHYGSTVPWWRVVPASSKPPHGHAAQALEHYKKEGTPIKPGSAPEGYRLRLALARLPYTHKIYDGSLTLHLERDLVDPESYE